MKKLRMVNAASEGSDPDRYLHTLIGDTESEIKRRHTKVQSIVFDNDADNLYVTVTFEIDKREFVDSYEVPLGDLAMDWESLSKDVNYIADYVSSESEWQELASKPVLDFDGFWTDYALYYNTITDMYVCIFGDRDLYLPGDSEPDAEFDSGEIAWEWFDDYDTDTDTLFESTQVDECQDIKAGTDKVTLTIQYHPYERYISTPLTRARVSGPNLLEALKNLVDKVGMYLDREQIEDEEMSPEDIIQYLTMVNGDGCDYITELKNASTGEILIEAEDFDEEEDWDD